MAKRSINIPVEELKEIKRLYLEENVSLTTISKLFHYSVHILSSRLKEIEVEVVNKLNLVNYDLDKDIIPLFKEGMSLTKLAEKFKTTRGKLSKDLKSRGFEIINHQNKTKFNENIFDCIDTEEKAYWLGFIYADGYISSSRYDFELSLSRHDIGHLYKFNEFMLHNKDNVKLGKIIDKNKKEHFTCRWSITNKHLWNTLNSYGCTPRKPLTLQFPDESIFADKFLIRHFIRGYFDGDGCISYSPSNKEKTKYRAISNILGTLDFLEKMETYLVGIVGFYPNTNHCEKAHEIRFSKEATNKLIYYLYSDSTIYLDRKYNRAMFFKDNCRSAEELAELLESEIGESPEKDNTEVISEITKGSETPLSVEGE